MKTNVVRFQQKIRCLHCGQKYPKIETTEPIDNSTWTSFGCIVIYKEVMDRTPFKVGDIVRIKDRKLNHITPLHTRGIGRIISIRPNMKNFKFANPIHCIRLKGRKLDICFSDDLEQLRR